jgi:hypothetical protein
MAAGSAVGDPDVPGKPANWCSLAGVIAAPAEVPLLPPHPASTSTLPAAATVVAAHQRRFQRR